MWNCDEKPAAAKLLQIEHRCMTYTSTNWDWSFIPSLRSLVGARPAGGMWNACIARAAFSCEHAPVLVHATRAHSRLIGLHRARLSLNIDLPSNVWITWLLKFSCFSYSTTSCIVLLENCSIASTQCTIRSNTEMSTLQLLTICIQKQNKHITIALK